MIRRLLACTLAGTLLGPAMLVVAHAGAPAAVSSDAEILHVLSRTTYGPRPGELARVRAQGLSAWLERQLDRDAAIPRLDRPGVTARHARLAIAR